MMNRETYTKIETWKTSGVKVTKTSTEKGTFTCKISFHSTATAGWTRELSLDDINVAISELQRAKEILESYFIIEGQAK